MAYLVSIGVPVYRGAKFVSETLRAIQVQTHSELDVLICLDGPDEACSAAVEPFLVDSRFRMMVQPEHIGWAANISSLIERHEGDFWYCNPQDDIVTKDYVEILLSHAERHPQAAVVYCDIDSFGDHVGVISQTSVFGRASARLVTLLHKHFPAVAFRGLTRSETLRQSNGVRGNEVEDFAADTVWMVSAARSGELHRVPLPLYRKRFHPENTHSKWGHWPQRKLRHAWRAHCRDVLFEALPGDANCLERRLIWSAGLTRLLLELSHGATPTQLAEDIDLFLEEMAEHRKFVEAMLELDWERTERWSRLQIFPPSGGVGLGGAELGIGVRTGWTNIRHIAEEQPY